MLTQTKAIATCIHAEYVELRRHMMQLGQSAVSAITVSGGLNRP